MGWTLGGTRIIVTDYTTGAKNIIARLQPIAGGTILQKFGNENVVYKIQGYVVGDTDLASVNGFASSSTQLGLLNFDGGLVVSGYVNNVNVTQILTVAQTIRPDLPCDDPVYRVDIEIYG